MTRNRGRVIRGYKDHRAVDDAHGIITATITTDAAVNEGQVLERVIQAHEAHAGESVGLVVADTQYGTGENDRKLHEAGITPCIPPKIGPSLKGKFPASAFSYDARADCYRCPGGQELHRERYEPSRRRTRYRARKEACAACPLRNQCTRWVRRVQRHEDQEHIDWAASCLSPGLRRYWRKRRQSVVEGRFGDAATHHGYKRARWRGRRKVTIQNLLIATCQNLRKLMQALRRRPQTGQGTLPGAPLAHWAFLEVPGPPNSGTPLGALFPARNSI